MKLRTIENAYKCIKENDPNTDVTKYMIRKLADQEMVSITRTGNKTLVDVDSVIDYLNGVKFTPTIVTI